MITALSLCEDGKLETYNTVDAARQAWSRSPSTLWIDLEAAAETDVRAVGEMFSLDAEAIEDCLTGEQRPRIDEYEDHVFIVLYGLPRPEGTFDEEAQKLAAFCGRRFLVTVHQDPRPAITTLHERCQKHAGPSIGRGPDYLLYAIIDSVMDRYTTLAESHENQVDKLEDASLSDDVDESILTGLSDVRRSLVHLRRLTAAQRELLLPVSRGEYDFVAEGLQDRFRHVVDHLTQAIEIIDAQRELLNGVRDNYHSAISNRMNQVMKTLTVFATIMLPLGLIAGIYGMNVADLPLAGRHDSFWLIVGIMVVLGGGMLAVFRRRRWL